MVCVTCGLYGFCGKCPAFASLSQKTNHIDVNLEIGWRTGARGDIPHVLERFGASGDWKRQERRNDGGRMISISSIFKALK